MVLRPFHHHQSARGHAATRTRRWLAAVTAEDEGAQPQDAPRHAEEEAGEDGQRQRGYDVAARLGWEPYGIVEVFAECVTRHIMIDGGDDSEELPRAASMRWRRGIDLTWRATSRLTAVTTQRNHHARLPCGAASRRGARARRAGGTRASSAIMRRLLL